MRNLKFLLAVVMAIAMMQMNAQNQIVAEHQGQTSVFESLAEAVSSAQAGDTLYLSGGNFSANGINFNKPIHLVGAGYDQDSTSATGSTYLGGMLFLQTLSSGCSLEGIYFINGISSDESSILSNIRIVRCHIPSLVFSGTTSNIVISHCVIAGFRGGNNSMTNNTIENCIVYASGLNGFNEGNIFNNNVFVAHPTNGFSVSAVSSCIFRNNLFMGELVNANNQSIKNNLFENNITTHSSDFCSVFGQGSNICSNNIFDVAENSLFENFSSYSFSEYFEQDFHLLPGSVAIAAGVNGSDCGIYGGENPFKEGGVPFNPHIQMKDIANETDSEGNLPVVIKVASQEN
jgi:hypothetical protein